MSWSSTIVPSWPTIAPFVVDLSLVATASWFRGFGLFLGNFFATPVYRDSAKVSDVELKHLYWKESES